MVNFIKSGIECNKAAKYFGRVYVILNKLDAEIQNDLSCDYSKYSESLFFLAYICRKEIIDRIGKYRWFSNMLMAIPLISQKTIPISAAYSQTVERVIELSIKTNFAKEVKNIFDKGEIYYQMERNIPQSIIDNFKKIGSYLNIG
ncbi:MAG: hypothetical protein HY951_16440 [Bacteroidia bacterium]|nr:hypothetical protein [Bacteroidia bacterium]